MMKIKTFGAALMVAAVVAGCTDKEEPAQQQAQEQAVTVAGQSLAAAELDRRVDQLLEAQKSRIPTNEVEYARRMFRNRIAGSFLVQSVLLAKAKEAGIAATDEDVKTREEEFLKAVALRPDAPKSLEEAFEKSPFGKEVARKEFNDGIVIEKFLKAEQAKVPAADHSKEIEEIIKNITESNAKMVTDEQAKEKIVGFKAQLDAVAEPKAKAEKFAELAKANSDCPSAAKGGDLDDFGRGQMVPEFDKAAFEMKVGEISEPIKTSFGYHLILKTAENTNGTVRASHILVKVGQPQPIPEKAEIEKYFKSQDEQRFVMDFVAKAIREAKPQVTEDLKDILPPEPPAEGSAEAPAEKPLETPAEK